jgi:ammonium transporter Rh
MGGSCFIHTFGGIFGLSVSYIITPKAVNDHPKNAGNNTTWLFATIGTIFLWMFWPSFNAAMATGL